MGSKWAYKVIYDEKGKIKRLKARRVTKGFAQAQCINYYETYSLIVNITSIRVLLAVGNRR